jgi:glutathione synthase/RimK-type ligase-like ATP-grasp enzyme
MDYAGVDIIIGSEGQYCIIEVNSIPAWKGLESVCQLHIADLLAEDLITRHLNYA